MAGSDLGFEAQRRCLLKQVRFAVEAGISAVQIRERQLSDVRLADLTRDVLSIARGSGTAVLVNDRVDVALSCGAHGVHLRSDSPSAASVRRIVPGGFLIGRSVHDAAEAAAESKDTDFLFAGTVWPTTSKREGHPLLGLSGLASIVQAASVPVLAIGGVTVDRLRLVTATGAVGAASIGMFMGPIDEARSLEDGYGTVKCRAVPVRSVIDRVRNV